MRMMTGAAVAFVVVVSVVAGGLLAVAGPGPECQLNRIGDICDPPTDYALLFREWAYVSVPGASVALLLIFLFRTAQRRQNR